MEITNFAVGIKETEKMWIRKRDASHYKLSTERRFAASYIGNEVYRTRIKKQF
jgi:hypothetical protein